jgi:hypothetical protein
MNILDRPEPLNKGTSSSYGYYKTTRYRHVHIGVQHEILARNLSVRVIQNRTRLRLRGHSDRRLCYVSFQSEYKCLHMYGLVY